MAEAQGTADLLNAHRTLVTNEREKHEVPNLDGRLPYHFCERIICCAVTLERGFANRF
jgi:hypothetical protein